MASLLCSTSDKDHINAQDLYGRPPIVELLDDPICIDILLSNGAKIDILDLAGRNIFHHVCFQGEIQSLRVLGRHVRKSGDDALVAESDYSGNTPLLEALSNANIFCAIELLALEDIGNIVRKDGWAVIHYVVKLGDPDLLEAAYKHPSFLTNMKTLDGKGVETVAMESDTRTMSLMSLATRDIINNGYAVFQLSNPEANKLHSAIQNTVDFFRRSLEQKILHSTTDYNHGHRPFDIEYSKVPDRPDMNECFTMWSNRLDLIPKAELIPKLTRSLLDWRDALIPMVKSLLDDIAKTFSADARPSFQKISHLQANCLLSSSPQRDLIQDKHEDGHMLTVWYSNERGLEIYKQHSGSEVLLPLLPARNEVLLMPGPALTASTGGAISPLYHQVRDHGLQSRQSSMYFINPEVDKPLYNWVKNDTGELTDIREQVQNVPLAYGLPRVEAL
ncbi:hypothetical protein N0V90_010896 [Kalmusia sp. IMI 367209]|nr:hypothetical protein N0V90_010896 [Kalmusia sp. IMI 367209]